ncbi:hypothetical protein HY989_01935 [Candidatus Micrarchaeota archaeon]|nr:hypothetical protein [Candidatus Micrarchaeota archaeon]
MQKILFLIICLLLLGCTQSNPQNIGKSNEPIPSFVHAIPNLAVPVISQSPQIGQSIEELAIDCKKFTLPQDCNEVPNDKGGDFCKKCREIGIAASPITSIQATIPNNPSTEKPEAVIWQYTTEWKPNISPPACPQKIVSQAPMDLRLATSILYPGQIRGGNYKPHGGARFDNSNNYINVYAPLDGSLVRGSRYLENGQIQYLLDIINPCGIMHRFDHLLELSPKFAKAAEKFRPAIEGDSRTTEIEPVDVKAGELIATKIGMNGNVGMDWGVYDLRKMNEASKNSQWLNSHPGQLAPYALCWLDLLPNADMQIAKLLPGGDSLAGKQSDYC